ncbi:MAG: hypothetical protein ACTSPB_19105 [Candidatus Thorarchaeota archaeon]
MEKEIDYKKLYLEQRVVSLRIESQALQLRFAQVQQGLLMAQRELDEYVKGEDQNGKC